MVSFIARRIETEAKKSISAGRAKYEAYFVKQDTYEDYREDVNGILLVDGYEDVIVS